MKNNYAATYASVTITFAIIFGSYSSLYSALDHLLKNYRFNYYAAAVPALVGGIAFACRKKESVIKIHKN